MIENSEEFEVLSCMMFDLVVKIEPALRLHNSRSLKVKVQGSKYYVTEECNIRFGVWSESFSNCKHLKALLSQIIDF